MLYLREGNLYDELFIGESYVRTHIENKHYTIMYDKKLKKGFEKLSYHKYIEDESRFTNVPTQMAYPYENFGYKKRFNDERKKAKHNYIDYDDVAASKRKVISYDDI